MKMRIILGACALGLVFIAAPTRRLVAQTEFWLATLTTPPPSAGTCMPSAPSEVASMPAMTRHRLVMVSVTPGSRREMSVSVDASGRARVYNETAYASTGRMSSASDDVIATIDPQGGVRGTRIHATTKLTDSMPARGDTAALRKWFASKRHSTSESTREPLDSAGHRTVVRLAAWLANRCK